MIIQTEIDEVYTYEPKSFVDERGYFFEAFRPDILLSATGDSFTFSQMNTSLSAKGTLRGFHFKHSAQGQSKFVTVQSGEILDFALDLRQESPTFRKVFSLRLAASQPKGILLGKGIAHAFLALTDMARVVYLVDSPYEPSLEKSINPMTVDVDWSWAKKEAQVSDFIMSEKDKHAPSLESVLRTLSC